MWLILLSVTALSIVEAVKMDRKSEFDVGKVHSDSPDPASSGIRRG